MTQFPIVKVDGDVLYAPIHHYRHPSSGRVVDLVLTVHYGEPDYYTQLGKFIAGRTEHGAQVYTEAHDPRTGLDRDKLTAAERKLVNSMKHTAAIKNARLPLIGWQNQFQGLPPQPGWKTCDLPAIDVIRGIGVRKMRVIFAVDRLMTGRRVDASSAHKIIHEVGRAVRSVSRPRKEKHTIVDRILIDRRNDEVITTLQADDRDGVVLYGLRHGPGLDTGLRTLGYLHTGTDWYRVAAHRIIGRHNRRTSAPDPSAPSTR